MSKRRTDVLGSTQHRSDRAAHEIIRGYVHQATLTAREWLRADGNEYLICEGNEDIDRLVLEPDGTFREIAQQQIKAIAGKVTARTPAVHESIFNFLRSFHVHDSAGRKCRFTFNTTAAKTKQRTAKVPKSELDSTDVLERWTTRANHGASDDPALTSAIRALAAAYLPRTNSDARVLTNDDPEDEASTSQPTSNAAVAQVTAVQDALGYLDAAPGRWAQFLDSVQWSFEEIGLSELETELVSALTMDPRTKALPHELLRQRLVSQVLSVSSKKNVEERTLTRASFDALVHASASELREWAERTHAAAFFGKLLEQETRIARIEKDISVEGKHHRAVQQLLGGLNDAAAQRTRLESAWRRYFKSRVVPGLFVPPPDFDATVDAFRAAADSVESVTREFEKQVASCAGLPPAFAKLDAARAALKAHAIARPGYGQHEAVAEWEESLLQRLRDVEDETPSLERGLRGSEVTDSERYAVALENRDWISEVQATFYELRRLRTPIWVSVAQAGRGKSNFAWELANALSAGGEAVILLSGKDIPRDASLDSVVRLALHEPHVERNAVLDALAKRYAQRGHPIYILLDAINEAVCSPQEAVEALKRLMDDVVARGGVRLFMTCRDVFWEYQYASEFELFAEHIELLEQDEIAPNIDDDAVTRYLDHFEVQNVVPSDLLGAYWHDNPLLLRLFCEAWKRKRYDGKKPIEFRSFPIIDGYLTRKADELRQRGFGVIKLQDELDRLAAVIIHSGEASYGWGRSIALVQARDAMTVKSASGERLFDALLDAEVLLSLEPVSPSETHACFALERVEDFFIARWVMRNLERWEDDALTDLVAAQNLTISAMGTAIAMALSAGRIANLGSLKRSLAKTMDTLFDLLEADQVAEFRSPLIDAATETNGVEALGRTLSTQLNADHDSAPPFFESLTFEILGAAVLRLSVTARHVRFFMQIDLVNGLADRLAAEVELLRHWALNDFAAFPSAVDVSPQRQEAVAILLAANSPHVRDLAHEWMFWTGRFRPAETIELLTRLSDDTDFLLRERIAALRYALLHRHPGLATQSMLRSVFDAAYRDPPELRHYLLIDFARKTLLEHWNTSKQTLTPGECAMVEFPQRVEAPPASRTYGQTQWTVRPPIQSDMSRYTFGSRFRRFRVRDADQAVRDTLDLLPVLGYSADAYQEADAELGRMRNPRHWGGQGRRYERFGKTWANVASFIVLQRWAETVPADGPVSELQRCFAFQSPKYDCLFTLKRNDHDLAFSTPLRIPASWSLDMWDGIDERDLITEFLRNFPDEVCVSLRAETSTPRLAFSVLRDGVVARPEVLDAWRFANQGPVSTDGRFPEPEGDEIDHNFDFHLLANVSQPPTPLEDKLVHVCRSYTRTLNDEDREVVTITPRIALAGRLRQTEIEGEFADETGATVVRRLTWQDGPSRGSAVLVRRDVLARILAELGVELAFDDYADLQGRTADGELDDDEPLLRRWRLTPTTDRELSKEVMATVNLWEAAHGALEPEERFRCHYFWSLCDEVGLEIALCTAERDRATSAGDEKLERKLQRRLKDLAKRLTEAG